MHTWQGKTEERMQWQNQVDGKPHFSGQPGNWTCHKPGTENTVQEKFAESDAAEEIEVQAPSVKVTNPFDEAELIVRWAREKAYKMVMVEVADFSKLTHQEKNSLGQAEGMLTRALVDTTINLMKIHNIKTDYNKEKKN